MKSTIQRVLFAVAVATLGAGAVGTASAQTDTAAPATSPQQWHRGNFRHFGGAPFVGSLLRATRQLNLLPQQKASIKAILAGARPAHQPGAQVQRPGITVLGNPGDPAYASAVQGAQTDATSRIQMQAVLAGQIYAVLNPAQQQQLPTVLASIQAKEQARRAAWAARRSNG